MEYTEPATAEMLHRNSVQLSNIESNNGGRGFSRAVESQLRLMGNRTTAISTFTQSDNKAVRIFSKSAEVQNTIIFPSGWKQKWPLFAKDVLTYRKEGNNAHDDAPDTLTGIVEKYGQGQMADTRELENALY